jgi:integrase
MVRKPGRRTYYYRRKVKYSERQVLGKKEVWVALGRDYKTACRRLRALKEGEATEVAAPVSSVVPPVVTVSELAKLWLELAVHENRNEDGEKLAKVRVQRYLLPALGPVVAASVTPKDATEYRAWVGSLATAPEKRRVVRVREQLVESEAGRVRPISRQTVAHVLADCRCLFLWAVEEKLLPWSPVPRRKWLPRVAERLPDRLTDKEVAKLLSIEEPYQSVIRLGLETGLRWGELICATAEGVERGLLTVNGEDAKSGNVRRVPIPPDLVAGRAGRLVPFTSASSFARTVREQSGVRRFHVHQLRHTFSCRWLERGGSLAALQEILGHASVVTTQRYARLGEDAVRTEWGRMGGRLFA